MKNPQINIWRENVNVLKGSEGKKEHTQLSFHIVLRFFFAIYLKDTRNEENENLLSLIAHAFFLATLRKCKKIAMKTIFDLCVSAITEKALNILTEKMW